MVEKLKASRIPKAPSTEQASSTAQTLARDPSTDWEWQNRALPQNWLAVASAKNMDEAVAARATNVDEVILIEGMRRQGHGNSQGMSLASSVSSERRDRGIEAFIYTPPAKVTKEEVQARAVGLVEYKSEPMKEVWVEMSWWQALLHRIRGNKVISTDKK